MMVWLPLILFLISSGWSWVLPLLRTVDHRIVGGQPVDIHHVPYQVVVEMNGRFHCGGSIIAPDTVLTAAHCVHGSDGNYTVRAGTTFYSQGGSPHNVNEILVHPGFNSFYLDYDVAVLFVDPVLELDETRQVIQVSYQEPMKRETAVVTGWGRISEEGPFSEQLQAVGVTIVDRDVCQELYIENADGELITQRMFCAGSAGLNHCRGDSGGPVVLRGRQVGTVSGSRGCAVEGLPGVNSNLAEEGIRSWLQDVAGV